MLRYSHMTTTPALAALAALASAACAIPDKSPPEAAESAELNLLLVVVDRNGSVVDTFERKDDVFIDVRRLDTELAVTAQDFAFQVVDPVGQLRSEDDIACRTFHVSEQGFIDKVNSAAPPTCVHTFVGTSDNRLLPNLMPFGGDSMRFTINVAPLATSDSFANALAASFRLEPPAMRCGDGVVDAGEQCDDANDNDVDTCRNDCTIPPPPAPVCGNGLVETGELCDDGNQVDTDFCRNDCTLPMCGNGIVEANEQCDDGNNNNGDACRNNCTRNDDD